MKQVSVVLVGLLLIHGVAVGDPLSDEDIDRHISCLLYTSPSPRDS